MRVAVVGAGIVGVSCAHELALQGHDVCVFERRASVAEEASFANAGVIAPGHVAPWAAPGMPAKVLGQLFGRHASVRLGGPAGLGALAQLPWLWRFWRACAAPVHRVNRVAMHQLAQYSRERTLELTRTLHLEYQQMPGYLVLLRGERELRQLERGLSLLQALGVPHALVDAQRCRQLEPGLHPDTALLAGLHLPQDGLGNCRQFAQLLKNQAQRLGAHFRFGTTVQSLQPGSQPLVILADGSRQPFDAVVVCAGVQANGVLRSVGVRLPLAPVYGYSITAPLRHLDADAEHAPRAALMDERHKVAISRLGQRVRVAGGAELGGRLDRMEAAPLRSLYKVLDDWFPGAIADRQAQQWKGARPMLPDGPPVLGPSGAPGIWLNLGHGANGWALACGSACVIAEQLAGRPSPVELSRFQLAGRF